MIGPRICSLTRLPWVHGKAARRTCPHHSHLRSGPVVRVAPDEQRLDVRAPRDASPKTVPHGKL
ncbi:hypothetical protein FKP32DRAFT_1590114 [Trametes sanguinea]|nr:hypothetical protein FKP32DRAFT_1590114 [Trametes sanguinea]